MEADLRHGRDEGVTKGAASQVLCRLEEIEDGAGKGFYFTQGAVERAIFVVREGDQLYGYENLCPHLGMPLEFVPDQFISADGSYILCSTHGALFRIEDGHCVSGPCLGANLVPVAVGLDGKGQVTLETKERAAQ